MEILFVHGRPAGHPLHAKYGKSVTSRFIVEDPWIRWHDKNYPFIIRYAAWVVNAMHFIKFKKTLVITEGLRLTLVIAKLMSFGNIKLIALVDDESPYFIHSRFYSKVSKAVNSWAYRKYDAWICIGKMETLLVQSIVKKNELIFTGFNGISKDRLAYLQDTTYSPGAKRIIFIGHGPGKWRMWYKGLDLMLAVFSRLIDDSHDLYFEIAGNWNPDELRKYVISDEAWKRIKFVGNITDLKDFVNNALLYLHTARGEAWGIAVNEAMASGIIPMVSEWTGTKECVEKVSELLIVKLDIEEICQRITWFLKLPEEEKMILSKKCREVTSFYTEENATKVFQGSFERAVAKLNL